MSFNKAIEHGKEHRKQYYKYCKLVDPSCRNHGSCSYCQGNRQYNTRKRIEKANYKEDDYGL